MSVCDFTIVNMIGTNSSDNNNSTANKLVSFSKSWLSIEKENLKKLELEEKILKLKKRELWKRYISVAIMAPFAIFMAMKLEAVFNDMVLLCPVNRIISYTTAPFAALSLTCTLYSIYNDRKIKKEEQELRDLESAEVTGKNSIFHNQDDYMNYVDACITTSIILGNIVSKVSEQYIVEDSILLFSNIVGFCMSYAFYRSEYTKSEQQAGKESGKKISNINSAKFILIGTFVLLIRKIILMTTESFIDTNIIDSIIGLAGILSIMMGYALNACFYSSELQDAKVIEEAKIARGNNDIGHDNLTYELDRGRA